MRTYVAAASGVVVLLAFVSIALAGAAPATTTTTSAAPTTASTAPAADDGWTILFRADDPLLWDTDAGGDLSAANGYAVALDKTPQDVQYLRIKRMDNGAAVIVLARRDVVVRKGDLPGDYYWNGASDPVTGD